MAGNFLTPTAIWKDFVIDGEVKAEVLKESSSRGVAVSHLRIHGRKTQSGEVGIYAVMVRKAQLNLAPGLIVVQDFKDAADTTLARFFAEKGYTVLAIDLAGAYRAEEREEIKGVDKPYTVYPEELSYANYDEEAESKAETDDVRSTCWYEWGRVIRYAAEYMKVQPLITKTGILGVGAAATALWQVLSADCGIAAAVVIGNAGWKGYRGINKFGDMPEPQFGDEALKYLAGVEPQAYAAHVKCPLMLLAPTNSPEFDIDRAYDTVSRVSEKTYTAVDYSVGNRYEIDFACFNDASVFFDACLVAEKQVLPNEVAIKSDFADGKLIVEVSPDVRELKEVCIFVSEEELTSSLRAWRKISDVKSGKHGTYVFEYSPYRESGAVTFFARAGYENGMHVCSVVMCKKFAAEDCRENKSRVLFTSLVPNAESGFYPATENLAAPTGINLDKKATVRLKNGPMELAGLCCKEGITTFKVNVKRYKPAQSAMFMLDVCVNGGGDFTVKAITDYFGNRTEYSATVKVFGDLWQNVKLETNNFKTTEGMGLKSFDNVQALEFYADAEFTINNLLWV